MLSYFAVILVPAAKRSRVVDIIIFSDEDKPQNIGSARWDSPDVLRESVREEGKYDEFPDRDGGSIFVKQEHMPLSENA